MRDRRLRQNAMSEIEDEWSVRECSHNVIDGMIEDFAAPHETFRIEIALYRDARLDMRSGKIPIDRGLKTDRIHTGLVDISRNLLARSARKSDDLCAWVPPTNFLDQSFSRLGAPELEILRRKAASPGIEDLYAVGTGIELMN